MSDSTRKYTASELNLKDEFYDSILNRTKTSTIRLGDVFFPNQLLPLKFETKPEVIVKVRGVIYNKFLKDLNEADAITDGFTNLTDLKTALLQFYPNSNANTQFTILHFELDR